MYSTLLRQQLTTIAKDFAEQYKLTYNSNTKKTPRSAIIFDKPEFTFQKASWDTIRNNTSYLARTQKAHSSFEGEEGKQEMQSSNSSDALLMNIFCNPKINSWKGIKKLLQVNDLSDLTFGHYPRISLGENEEDRTEIDLFIKDGDKKIFCESKLTETDFGFKPLKQFERYKYFETIFDAAKLPRYKGEVANYQLVRNILAAHERNAYFYLFIDARRPDLSKSFYQTVRCIKAAELRMRCDIFYWQDIAALAGRDLQVFLCKKYGI